MDARNVAQRIVAILVIASGAWGGVVFAAPVYIYHGEFNLPIPAPDEPKGEYGQGRMEDAVINVTDHILISDLDVRISLTHESLFDLQILLQSPAGTNVALNLAGNLAFIVGGEDGRLTAVGGSGQWFFDDEAEVSIEQATEPFFGSFRPVWTLSFFDKEDAFGPWSLQIYDAFYADTGTLDSFELMITTIPEPATAIFLTLGAGLMRLHKRRGKAKVVANRHHR